MTLINGDCLEILKTLPEQSVDSIITDPPYGIDYQSARRTDKTKRLKKISNDKTPFIWWLYDAFRVCKDGGGLIVFCRWDVQEAFRQAIEWSGFTIKSQVIWFAVKGKFKFPGKRPKSVIHSQRISGEKLLHPNEKPIDLMEQLIEAVAPREGTVLDCFMGSGSTGVACKNLDRKFIGIEKDPQYFEIAKKRIAS